MKERSPDEPGWSCTADAEAQTAMLAEPVWDLCSRGGKHWRPIFGLLLLEALGVDVARDGGMVSAMAESNLDPVRNRQALVDEKTGGKILQAHAFKSAAAVRATADVAAIIADADPATRSACARLSESWGVAFQMIDDVNNFSASPRWSKMRGEEVAEGKHSYVILS